jgi:hypothetical protein
MSIKEKVSVLILMMNRKNKTIKKKMYGLLNSMTVPLIGNKPLIENKPLIGKKPPLIENKASNSKKGANVIISVKDSNNTKQAKTFVTLIDNKFDVSYE